MCINKNPEILEPEKPYTHKLMNNLILSFCCSRSRKRKKSPSGIPYTHAVLWNTNVSRKFGTHTKEIQNFVVFFFFQFIILPYAANSFLLNFALSAAYFISKSMFDELPPEKKNVFKEWHLGGKIKKIGRGATSTTFYFWKKTNTQLRKWHCIANDFHNLIACAWETLSCGGDCVTLVTQLSIALSDLAHSAVLWQQGDSLSVFPRAALVHIVEECTVHE